MSAVECTHGCPQCTFDRLGKQMRAMVNEGFLEPVAEPCRGCTDCWDHTRISLTEQGCEDVRRIRAMEALFPSVA